MYSTGEQIFSYSYSFKELRKARSQLVEEQAQIEEDRNALVAFVNGLLEELFECKAKVW